jgi:hypothetical protein
VSDSFSWRNIPGYFDFDNLYSDAVVAAPPHGARFVEIGVMFGRSTCFMAEAIRSSGKSIAFDAIDGFAWRRFAILPLFDRASASSTCIPGLRSEVAPIDHLQGVASYLLKRAGVDSYVQLVCARGQDRVEAYDDNSLDLVFIDAQHTYDDTAELLRLYLPKVKSGGVLAGHDFDWSGVSRAVEEILGAVEADRSSFVYRKP